MSTDLRKVFKYFKIVMTVNTPDGQSETPLTSPMHQHFSWYS